MAINKRLKLADVDTEYSNYNFIIINDGINIDTEYFNKTSWSSPNLKLTHKTKSNLEITIKEDNAHYIKIKSKK